MPSKISWTQETWNPVTGCSKVSQGCRFCYAEALSLRYGWSKNPWAERFAAENVVLHPDRLAAPLHWRKPRRVFVDSMSDLFHEAIPDEFIDRVFRTMQEANWHVFQVLTKRADRMRDYITRAANRVNSNYDWPLRNVWLGTSVENQRWADERIPLLLDTPAAVRFVSCEPLLGPVDLSGYLGEEEQVYGLYPGGDPRDYWPDVECCSPEEIERWQIACKEWDEGVGTDRGPSCATRGDGSAWTGTGYGIGVYTYRDVGLSWLIAGGESGPRRRPMRLEWLESVVAQCQAAGVSCWVKQDSALRPGMQGRISDELWRVKEWPV